MKRSFRVASVFTGAAAATAAFAPAAMAAPTTTEAPATTNAAIPQTVPTVKLCAASTENWVHLTYTPTEKHAPECFGGYGTYPIKSGRYFQSVCPGNNYGYVVQSGHHYSFGKPEGSPVYWPGDAALITAVHISGHYANNHYC
jgi:hypothetical protein